MVLVISTFRVANGLENEVRRAFRERPRLVDDAAGFLGLEVFTSAGDPTLFHLATRWIDEDSFRQWHASDEHRQSHVWIPKGLKLDARFTRLLTLERVEDAAPAERLAADAAPVIAAFGAASEVVHIVACHRDGRVRSLNGAFHKLTGAEEGADVWAMLTAGDADTLRRLVSAGARSRQRRLLNFVDRRFSPHTLSCVVDVQPDGFLLLGEPAVEAERQLHDELLRLNNEMAVLMRENTRKSKALEAVNAALQRSNQDLEQFAAAISHDLRSPLGAVSACVGALAQQVGSNLGKDAEVLCEFILRGVGHMREMITGLLDYSRVSTADLLYEKVDSRRQVEIVIEALGPLIEDNSARIEVGELPEVVADPIQLRRVFQNLIGNAIQNRGPESPWVRVSASREEKSYRFAVADNGRGIEPGIAQAIFEPFRRGRSDRYEGTGLGLALCRRVVERHGGCIWVESQPGAGSTFFFTIPER